MNSSRQFDVRQSYLECLGAVGHPLPVGVTMKTLQSQRKFAVLWIFVFVAFQALGRPLHVWSGCSQVCGTGSNCCVLDASHLEQESSAKQNLAASKRMCTHCNAHERSKSSDAAAQEVSGYAGYDLQWSSGHSHECSICQWFSTPSLATPEFTLRDAGNVVFALDNDRPIDMAASVSTDQSPRGPPQ